MLQVTTMVPAGTIISWDQPGKYGATLKQLTIGLAPGLPGSSCTVGLNDVMNASMVSCLPSPSVIYSTAGVNPATTVDIFI